MPKKQRFFDGMCKEMQRMCGDSAYISREIPLAVLVLSGKPESSMLLPLHSASSTP